MNVDWEIHGPLGELTVPSAQRNFATRANLSTYGEKIAALKGKRAKLITVFGIGRMFHIAFWEPHFAAEFDSVEAWQQPTCRLGAKLHPLTIEQNAITRFKSRTTLVPARANTNGPGLFFLKELAGPWVAECNSMELQSTLTAIAQAIGLGVEPSSQRISISA